ncbi:MAG: hypothetical protein FWD75_01985 [Propionibacteriaceae bacterium]|nr:hypothetical protein [Propionibacteriaceae bacterium]
MGKSPRVHHLAPDDPYQIRLTLETADDLEAALTHCHGHGRRHVVSFARDVDAAMERISVLPHLGRFHHDALRVTALARHPYRIWYIVDDHDRVATLLGLLAVTRASPDPARLPGPWTRVWWRDMPHLPAVLPDPYPCDDWTAEHWQEEDDHWWQPRMDQRR